MSHSEQTLPNDWKPDRRAIEIATSLLKSALPRALEVPHKKRPEIKDIYAICALSDALSACLPVLPPAVAALARQYYQTVQDAYRVASDTNERPSEHLNPDQRSRC